VAVARVLRWARAWGEVRNPQRRNNPTRSWRSVLCCRTHRCTAMRKCRVGRSGLARGDRKWPLNDGRIPKFRGVRVHASTGYNRVEGNRRASRNGRVSDLPPKIPNVTIRNCFIAVWCRTDRCQYR
jgi:hypothetical protein